jgi:hypothetical protein
VEEVVHCFVAVVAPWALGDVSDSTHDVVDRKPTMHNFAGLHELSLGAPVSSSTHAFPKYRVACGLRPFVFLFAVVENFIRVVSLDDVA